MKMKGYKLYPNPTHTKKKHFINKLDCDSGTNFKEKKNKKGKYELMPCCRDSHGNLHSPHLFFFISPKKNRKEKRTWKKTRQFNLNPGRLTRHTLLVF